MASDSVDGVPKVYENFQKKKEDGMVTVVVYP